MLSSKVPDDFIKFTSYASCQEVDSDYLIIVVMTAKYVSCKCELCELAIIAIGVSHSKREDSDHYSLMDSSYMHWTSAPLPLYATLTT